MDIFRLKKLIGIDAIGKYLQLPIERDWVILSWIRDYDFPAKKESSQLVAKKSDVKRWAKKNSKLIKDEKISVIFNRKSRGSYGFLVKIKMAKKWKW